MTLVFTLCSNNYLAQAITLGDSLLKHNPEYTFKIGLVDKHYPHIDYIALPYYIIEVESIGIKAFDDMFKRYSISELNTAVKPFYFKYFFNSLPEVNSIIYLDPDILVYQPFTELEEILEENGIVITPHFTTPIDDDKFQAENDFLNAGLYNLGFIALKKDEESEMLLEWWAKRLETKAYVDFAKGMFTDQLWINFVPLFFKKVHMFRHPGYNMAYWNLHERFLKDNCIVDKNNTSFQLVFYHFSGYDPFKPAILSKYQDRFTFESRPDIVKLFNEYSTLLKANKHEFYSKVVCDYVYQKEKIDESEANYRAGLIPLYKRAIRKMGLYIIQKFKINTDYYIR